MNNKFKRIDYNYEDKMVSNIENALNGEFIIEMLKRSWNREHDIHSISKLIGEVYTINIICKDGFGFKFYMKEIESLYTKLYEKKISYEEFNIEKSKLISIVIAKKLGIDISKGVTEEDKAMVKSYFLEEYVRKGYVSHSFPQVYSDSIKKDGLISSTKERSSKPLEIQEIQDIFMSKGVVAPLGGYPYYEGEGIYFEHDFTKLYNHAVYSPEWFAWFTSSDHTKVFHNQVETTPYVLRNEECCRRNVYDLCENAGLNNEEKAKVINFYRKTYETYKSPRLCSALISKKRLGKDNIDKVVPSNMDLLSTINYVLKDGAKEYVEHQGNVYIGKISPEDFKITTIPSASKYIYTSSYLRESKEQLTNPLSNLAVLRNAEKNKHRMNVEMARKVEQARLLLESKQQYELSKSDELKI